MQCASSSTYPSTVKSVFKGEVLAYTPQIDKVDVNKDCHLTVVNSNGQASNPLPIMFVSYFTDYAEAWRWLGMSLASFITAVVVIIVVVLVIVVLCTLSICCGVSLACLNCFCPRRSQPTIVLSPQSSGYASMA